MLPYTAASSLGGKPTYMSIHPSGGDAYAWMYGGSVELSVRSGEQFLKPSLVVNIKGAWLGRKSSDKLSAWKFAYSRGITRYRLVATEGGRPKQSADRKAFVFGDWITPQSPTTELDILLVVGDALNDTGNRVVILGADVEVNVPTTSARVAEDGGWLETWEFYYAAPDKALRWIPVEAM